MTAPVLLGWIALAIVGQLVLGIAIAVRTRDVGPSPVLSAQTTRAAWQGLRQFYVAGRAYEDPSHSQCSFKLVPVDGHKLPPFQPGQFLTFIVPITEGSGTEGDDVAVDRLTRNYSLSNAPSADHYRITVKRALAPRDRPDAPAGLVSSFLHDRVEVGAMLETKAPSGQFVIDPDPMVPVVLIGGGIGVTPLMSMLSWCLSEQPQRRVTMFYGVGSGADHAFKGVLRTLADAHPNFDLHVLYFAPGADDVEGRDFRHRGVITQELLQPLISAGRHSFYVCGPPPMMASIVPGLAAAGVAARDIHFEAFGPASVRRGPSAPPETPSSFEVQFRDSGRTLTWDGAEPTLLDFAESNGITIASGCRSGSCGTCETRLMKGKVSYGEAPAFDVTSGFCLPCVAVPQSALVLDA